MGNLSTGKPSSPPQPIFGPKPPPQESSPPTTTLPPLSPTDHKIYNHLAETMDYYHNHFRQTWTLLSTSCKTHTLPPGYTPLTFLQTTHRFLSQLHMHHTLEEAHIFPHLGSRMPEFASPSPPTSPTATAASQAAAAVATKQKMIAQHREIHEGIEALGAYVKECRGGGREFRLEDMEGRMGWGGVLERHLLEEVRALGAENMRLYWSGEEMGRMPM